MKSEQMKKNKTAMRCNSPHFTVVGRMAAGQTVNMGPCSKKQTSNPVLNEELQENVIQQSQRGKAHDEQPGSAKQTQHVEHSQGHERYFHKQSGTAKQSGKNPASEKVFQKQLIHERRSREQTAPVDYSVEHSGTGRQPAGTDNVLLERCWYCKRLFPLEERNISQENGSFQSSVGTELNYQPDPRPHFGVAQSSRSTAGPLWRSDGPREMQRDLEEKNSDSISKYCPHCYLRLPVNTLLWHEEKCLLFGGSKKHV